MNKKNLPKNDEVAVRSFGVADFRAAEEGSTVEGHAAVYDQKVSIGGWFDEIIERGAFDGCDFDDVLFFVNHDTRKIPLARSRRNNGNSTMQLSTDEKGLFIKSTLDIDNNTESKSLYSSIKRGDIDGMSFMFTIAEAKWTDLDTDTPCRHILKIRKVYEVSAVNMPAYSNTDINARDKSALDNARAALDNAKQELDNSTKKNEAEILRLKNQNILLMKG